MAYLYEPLFHVKSPILDHKFSIAKLPAHASLCFIAAHMGRATQEKKMKKLFFYDENIVILRFPKSQNPPKIFLMESSFCFPESYKI